ncbi:Uncharacterized protein APZ42_031358 [Daphnia magna]|uniref:MADF domain-containing protein n=1 Tax=Daphnia magna TaxID=35525 RepID=A0A164MXM1_9CRUS|nr:Uncharacterized protein APZ42_031358 [Daphnia magna]
MPKRRSPMKSPNLGVSAASKQITNAYVNEKRVKMWSKATTERFIQSIEKQSVLYDVTMSDYKNHVSQATARAVFGRELSISMLFTFSTNYCKYILLHELHDCFSTGPDDVKNKWKQLKDTYRNKKKRLSEEDPSGSGLEGSKRAKKRWIYVEQMGFLSTLYDDAEYEYFLLISRVTNVDDEDEEGKRNEYLEEEDNTTVSLNEVENDSEFSDDYSFIEMDPIASGRYKETIEGRKEPGFKTPVSSAPSRTAPRKKKGIIKNVFMFCKKASPEGKAAKEIGQMMKTIEQVLESKPDFMK